MPLGPQKNIKTDFGAVGNTQYVSSAGLSITASSNILACSSPLWASGDVGKVIYIGGGGGGVNGGLVATISSFIDSQHIRVSVNATTQLTSATPTTLAWGTDDSSAFIAMQAFAIGQLPLGMDLFIPTGNYMLSFANSTTVRWTRFITTLQVTSSGNPIFVGGGSIGAFVYPEQATLFPVSARVNLVNAGSNSVTLTNSSNYVLFQPGNTYTLSDGTVYTAGTTGIMRAFDMQGFGDPNPFYWEYVTITGVSSTTGAVTFSAPLRNNYNRNFPCYVNGGSFSADGGGPPTLYMLDASWNCTQSFSGLQFWNWDTQVNTTGQNLTFSNVTWLSPFGPNPSVSDTWRMDTGSVFTNCLVEVDKCITNLQLDTCVGHVWWLQSASIEHLSINNCTLDQLKGTGKNTIVTNSSIINLGIGPTGYGRADSFYAIGNSFSQINNLSVIEPGINQSSLGWSVSDGVITYIAASPVRWGIPGTVMVLQGAFESEGIFTATYDVSSYAPTANSTITHVGTSGLNQSGSVWPNVPLEGGLTLNSQVHPAPLCYFSSNIGCATAVDLSNANAQNKPIYSYSNRVYTGNDFSSQGVVSSGVVIWGIMSQVNVTVNTPYTGGNGTLTMNVMGQFNPPGVSSNGSPISWVPSVNLKSSGLRSITATSVTGALTGDSITAPGSIWLAGFGPFISASISSESSSVWPSVTIEVVTNQGIKSPAIPIMFHK